MLVFEEVAPLEQQGSAHVNYLFRARLAKEAEQVLALESSNVGQRVVVKFSKVWLLPHLEREAAAICQHRHPNLLQGYAPRDTSQGFLLRGFDPAPFLRYLGAKGWTKDDLSQALVMQRLALVSDPDVLAVPLSSFEGVLFGSTGDWRLPPKGLLPEAYLRFVRALCLQAFRAVAYVHQQTPPLIHGDLKPNNFLLCESLQRDPEALTLALAAHPDLVKLIDFGLQREEGKAASHSFGVPYYLAPECLTEAGRGQRGRLHAVASDTWSLGFTLCFLFFRDLPELRSMLGMGFDWKDLRSRLVERFQERGLTGLLADLWSRMLAPLPEHRPSMQEVVALAEAYAWDSREPLAALHPYILETKPLPKGLPETLQGWLPLLLKNEPWESRLDASALVASHALLRVEGMLQSEEENQRALAAHQESEKKLRAALEAEKRDKEAARKDAASARQEAALAKQDLEAARKDAASARQEAATAQQEKFVAVYAVTAAHKEAQEAKAEANVATQALERTQKDATSLREKAEKAARDLEAAQKALRLAKEEAENARKDAEQAKSSLQQAQRHMGVEESELPEDAKGRWRPSLFVGVVWLGLGIVVGAWLWGSLEGQKLHACQKELAQGSSDAGLRVQLAITSAALDELRKRCGSPPPPPPPPSGECRAVEAGGATFQVCPIPAGSFTMGSPPDEKERGSNEGPQRTVTITRPFWMMATEVTQGQFKALLGYNPSNFSSCGDSCPVESVSWNEAAAFANALSSKQGKTACFTCEGSGKDAVCKAASPDDYVACQGWRLPTEAEWEYAARAGTTTRFHTGDCITPDQANFDGNNQAEGCPKGESRGKTLPVGSLAKNGWGLFDMHGNVREWVYDFSQDSYTGLATENPTGPRTASFRVNRGGGLNSGVGILRAVSRGRGIPSRHTQALGFRLSTLAP